MRLGINLVPGAAAVAVAAAGLAYLPVDHPAAQSARGHGVTAATRAAQGLTLRPSPAAPGSLAPQLAASPDGRLFLSWLEPAAGNITRFRLAEWTATGWEARPDIVEGAHLFANWADVPSVFASRDGRLAAHWLEKVAPATFAYGIRVRLSSDSGRTWSPPVTPHRDDSPTEHGFLSFFDAPGGAIGMVWLDGRETAAAAGAAAHASGHGHGGGAMTLRATTLAAGASGSFTPGPDTLVDPRVCDCCPTAAVRTAAGAIAAYRDRSDDEVRDIAVARLEGGRWIPGGAIHADGWVIPGCPVNGPALSSADNTVAIAWFTAAGDQGRALVALSRDGGATFGRPVRVDDGEAIGRMDVEALADGSAVALWIEFKDGKADLRLRRVWPDGRIGTSIIVGPVGADRSSGYPRLVRHGAGLVLAWRAPGQPPVIQVAMLAVPGGAPAPE